MRTLDVDVLGTSSGPIFVGWEYTLLHRSDGIMYCALKI